MRSGGRSRSPGGLRRLLRRLLNAFADARPETSIASCVHFGVGGARGTVARSAPGGELITPSIAIAIQRMTGQVSPRKRKCVGASNCWPASLGSRGPARGELTSGHADDSQQRKACWRPFFGRHSPVRLGSSPAPFVGAHCADLGAAGALLTRCGAQFQSAIQPTWQSLWQPNQEWGVFAVGRQRCPRCTCAHGSVRGGATR